MLERNPDNYHHYQILEVALATTAAPSYFKSVKLDERPDEEFIDGGFGANNPSQEAYRSVKQLFGNQLDSIGLLMSIGTGKNKEASNTSRSGYRKYLRYYNAAAKWATDSENTHQNVHEALTDHADYYRLNVEDGLGKMKLDAWKGVGGSETLELIRNKTQQYLATEVARRSIRDSAERLVRIRRARANWQDRDRWERFCHGVQYNCDLPDPCGHGGKFFDRQNYMLHIQEYHRGRLSEADLETILDRGKYFQLFPNDSDPLGQ